MYHLCVFGCRAEMGNEQFHISHSEHHMLVNFYQSLHILHRWRGELCFQIVHPEELDHKSLLETTLINKTTKDYYIQTSSERYVSVKTRRLHLLSSLSLHKYVTVWCLWYCPLELVVISRIICYKTNDALQISGNDVEIFNGIDQQLLCGHWSE